MTIQLSILNKDAFRAVEVEFNDKSYGSDHPDTTSLAGEVAPGESKDFWIHDMRYLVVKEKKEGA